MKECIHCGHAVSRGDRHSLRDCPPRLGKTGEHHRRKLLAKRHRRRLQAEVVMARGEAVAGIHKKRGGKGK